jgi:RsiW-degrading membrane proteinase PrsW (M82 family)
LPHPTGFPPILAIVAVLICAGLLTAFYQAIFPRPARWLLILTAFVAGMAVTAGYVTLLSPASERLAGITDAWSALRVMAEAAGLPEEAVKLIATAIALLIFARSVSPAEAFQASLVAALGFAALENLQYVRALPEAALPVAFGRGIVASFVHSMMGMFQGYFLAQFVRSRWRGWHLPILGYLVAATAHSLFDWGLVRPLLEYFTTKTVRPEAVMEALPIIIPCVLGVILVSLFLFRRELRKSGVEFRAVQDIAALIDVGPEVIERHARLCARWRRVGNVLIVVGLIGLAGSIAIAVASTIAMRGQPQPTDLSQVTPEQMRASIILTVVLAASPMLILFGWLARQKQ